MVSEPLVEKSVTIPGSADAIERLCEQLLLALADAGFSEEDIFAIHLAVEEAFLNACIHGNKGDSAKQIRIECAIRENRFDVSITDQGDGFAPDNLPDPRSEENLYKPSGRGVLLMRSYMDEVEYNEKGNCVRMVKRKSGEKG